MLVGRKRKRDRHLPRGVTRDYGTYYFRGPDRKRVRLGRTLPESMAAWAELIEPNRGPVLTIKEACERYQLEVLPKRAEKTQRNQRYMFPAIVRAFGHMEPSEVKARDGYGLLASMAKTPTQGLKLFNLLSAVLTQCVRWGAIDQNPFWQVRKGDYTPAPRSRCPSDAEFAAVYGLASERLQIAMDLALLTGLRRSGVLGLTLDAVTDAGLLVQRPGKRTKPLLFEWTPELTAVVERAQRLEPRVRRALLCAERGKYAGKPYTPDGFEAIWQRLMKRAIAGKVIAERFTFNDLRSKSATDSVSAQDASDRLGHSSVEITKRVYIRKPTKVRPLR
jgi:integrase